MFFVQSMILVICSDSGYFQMHIMRVVMILFRLYVSHPYVGNMQVINITI